MTDEHYHSRRQEQIDSIIEDLNLSRESAGIWIITSNPRIYGFYEMSYLQ